MKNYFTSDLKGGKLFLPILVLMLVMMGIVAWSVVVSLTAQAAGTPAAHSMTLLAPHTPLDGDWVVQLFSSLGFALGYLLVMYGVLFFVVKFTLGSLTYKGERFDTSGMSFGHFAPRMLGWTALTIVTCFIYLPWMLTNIIRYFAERTRLREQNFRFNGSGSALFGFAVLCYILPLVAMVIIMGLFMMLIPHSAIGFAAILGWVMMFAITILASLFYAYRVRWSIDFSHDGSRLSAASMPLGKAMWFILGQMWLTVITLGLYAPAFILRLIRYTLRNTTVVESDGTVSRRGGYDFRTCDYWFILGQILLSFVTVGIYAAWGYATIIQRIAKRSYFEEM